MNDSILSQLPANEQARIRQIIDDDDERIECAQCHYSVLMDEHMPCPDCDSDDIKNTGLCIYCYEDGCEKCAARATA